MDRQDTNLIQGTAAWHDFRSKGIGGSEIAATQNKCPYMTPFELWQIKTGRKKGFEGNSFTQHGQETEARARARFELLCMDDFQPACMVHPTYPICRVSLDGISTDKKTNLEIKCPVGLDTIECADKGVVIDHYMPQVQYQMAVSGTDQCHFFVYHDKTQRHAMVTQRPLIVMQGQLIAAALHFWERYVLTDTPPPLTERDAKDVTGHREIESICSELIATTVTGVGTKFKDIVNELKARAIEIAGHPKIRCGVVQISTVKRKGEFSYHKLTIRGATEAS